MVMGRLAPPLMWALCLVCSALGCRAIIGVEEAEPYPEQSSSGAAGAGASSTGGNTNTTTTGGSGAASTSTGGMAGAGPSCEGQVNLGEGETPQCQDCVAANCCNEYLACINGSCDGLVACGNGTCGDPCLYAICDSGYALTFYKDCADCLSENCCAQYAACAGDPTCGDCVMEIDLGACDLTTLDEDIETCTTTFCDGVCV